MKLVLIKEEEKVLFAELDPFGFLDSEERVNELCFGAVEEGEDGDIPVGLMICFHDDELMMVRWLLVAPEYRGKGYGDELLSAAFTAAQNAGLKEVGAYLTKDKDRELICPDEEMYLKMNAFDREVTVSDDGSRVFIADVYAEDDEEMEGIKPYDIFENLMKELEAAEQ